MSRTKGDNSKCWKEDQGRELEPKPERHFPAACGFADSEQAQDNSQGQDTERIGNVEDQCLCLVELDFETQLVEAEHGDEHPAKDPTWEKGIWEF